MHHSLEPLRRRLWQIRHEIAFFHGEEGLQLKELDPERLPTKLLIPREVATLDPYFKELVPGSSISWKAPLPAVQFDDSGPEVTYSILWPGGQIPVWDLGDDSGT